MALTNFTLPFGGGGGGGALTSSVQSWGATNISPVHNIHQLSSNTNNLLYAPADHQQQGDGTPPIPSSDDNDFYKNNPYAPPQIHQQQIQYNNRRKNSNTYLPPIPPPGARNTQYYQQQQFSHINTQNQQQQQQQHQQQQIHGNSVAFKTTNVAASQRTYGEGTYSRFNGVVTQQPSLVEAQQQQQQQQRQQQQQQQQQQYYNSYSASHVRASAAAAVASSSSSSSSSSLSSGSFNTQIPPQQQQQQHTDDQTPDTQYGAPAVPIAPNTIETPTPTLPSLSSTSSNEAYPARPPGFTRVQASAGGSRTQVHAVLDYDVEEGEEEEEYYDDEDPTNKDGSKRPTVTPIQGPIFLKNGTVPVVPLFSYPTINNGSFVQIPIWWTALSVALGLDVRGDIIKGVPCVKRYHQLFCPTAGNTYPIDKIERFIDDNKALMRRMYGDFEMNMDPGGPRQQLKKRKRRFIDEPDLFIPPGVFPAVITDGDGVEQHDEEAGETYFGKFRRNKRQANRNGNKGTPTPGSTAGSSTGRLDACESKVEIVTPYWASNSAGKIRAIVNTQHFEQAIHQEICSKTQTSRCERDCGCEQKYKWHRLLAYDPDNDCKGIFMDWFLFPSCCVCRCNP